ncbi:MAG: iron-containing alcohol dehydrogenase [Lachnospiraceae bacterium]|nr:iron-containing alcohol dehydrogenase [Lachnospiraceae bacterium]
MSNNFKYYVPTEVIFGKGTESQVAELVKKYGGSKVLIVYGGQSAVKSGLLQKIEDYLTKGGVAFAKIGGVVPNPLLSKVYEGIELAKKEQVDFLLPVGGGSVIDTAKAIAYALAEPDKDVWDLYEHTRKASGSLPLGAVLTIAAAGSETSDSSVITNENNGEKRGYNDDLCRPKFAIMNPELTMTLPDYQTQSGCADMQMHTMERYFTNQGNLEITDSMAEALMRTVMTYAKILHEDPANYEARAEVMWAGSLAHSGLTGCGNGGNDFASHRLEHEMGGMFNVTHGAGLAAIWGSWARYVYRDCLHRFVKFAVTVHGVTPGATDEETAMKGIEAQEAFYRSVGMPTCFSELGISPSDAQILEMAKRCSAAVGGSLGAAKVLYEKDFVEIYRMANH